MSAPHADRDHSEQPTQPEAFVELLPPDVGHNLRHLGPERAHVTGEECHCSPERIPHPTQGTSRAGSAREVRASEAQVEAAIRAFRDYVRSDDKDPSADGGGFRAVADAVVAAGPDADEVTRLRAEVERLRASIDRARMERAQAEDAETEVVAERDRLAEVVARVERVRQRLLDPVQHVTEGPLISRIKAESWLRAALSGPTPAKTPQNGPEPALSREQGTSGQSKPTCGGCGATWPDLHVYHPGPGGTLCVKCGWTPDDATPTAEAAGDAEGQSGEGEALRGAEKGACGMPGPYEAHCTDGPGHRYSCYDAGEDVSFNDRQEWVHRHEGCPDDGSRSWER